MISSVNFSGLNSVGFNGEIKKQNYSPRFSSSMNGDVFQLSTPRKKEGFLTTVKKALTNPIKSAAADVNELKASEYERMYDLADDYSYIKADKNEQLKDDIAQYFTNLRDFKDILSKAQSEYAPAPGTNFAKVTEGTCIMYDIAAGQAEPYSIVYNSYCDKDDVTNAQTYINFKSHEVLSNVTEYPQGSDLDFEAEKVAVLSTADCDSSMTGDLAKKLGGPFLAYGFQKTSDGKYYADSITVFHRDTQGKLKSATTYNNVKIDDTINNSSLSIKKRMFGVAADEVSKTLIDKKGLQDKYYYQNYDKFTGIIDSPEINEEAFETKYYTCERAAGALQVGENGTAKAYLDYVKDTDQGLNYSTQKTVNI